MYISFVFYTFDNISGLQWLYLNHELERSLKNKIKWVKSLMMQLLFSHD